MSGIIKEIWNSNVFFNVKNFTEVDTNNAPVTDLPGYLNSGFTSEIISGMLLNSDFTSGIVSTILITMLSGSGERGTEEFLPGIGEQICSAYLNATVSTHVQNLLAGELSTLITEPAATVVEEMVR